MTEAVSFTVPEDLLRAAVVERGAAAPAVIRTTPARTTVIGAAGIAFVLTLTAIGGVLLAVVAAVAVVGLVVRRPRTTLLRLSRPASLTALTRAMAVLVAAEMMMAVAGEPRAAIAALSATALVPLVSKAPVTGPAPTLGLYAGVAVAVFGGLQVLALHVPSGVAVIVLLLAGAVGAFGFVVVAQLTVFSAGPDLSRAAFTIQALIGSIAGGISGLVLVSLIDEAQGEEAAATAVALVTVIAGILVAAGGRRARETTTTTASPRANTALEINDLDFAYGTQPVLFGVSLAVQEGEIAALLGTNGAGKSTILRAVAGLDPPTGGSIHLFGTDTTYLDAREVIGLGVGLLAGGRMTFPSLTVEENLRVGGYRTRRDGAALRRGIDDVYGRFPALAPKRAQKAGTLSGGEQQMLALGRVLLTRPRLLLIDELTLGLAPKVVEELIAIVRAVNAQGSTVVLVEQSANLALALASHSFFLERGAVRFDGPTAGLLERDDLLRPVFLSGAS